jgi:DNA-binding XRE family transcriptional regulator
MTQEVFAERIGISQNYLSTIEHGKEWGGDPASNQSGVCQEC